ncbi:hypothetical protein APSETT444_005779 [Aspergillus pseudonomiae]
MFKMVKGFSTRGTVLGAPTRKEVDKAHQTGQWLDVDPRYNSTVFSSVSANAYHVFAANGSPNDTALSVIESDFGDNGNRQAALRLHAKAQNGTLHRLENSACVDAYATAFQSTYGSLILVTGNATPADHFNLVYTQQVFKTNVAVVGVSGYNWICEDLEYYKYEWQLTPCITSLPQVQARVAENNWTVGGYKSEYCLVEEPTPHCKLQYNLYLVVIVIAFNIVKAIVLCYVAFNLKDSPLLNTGDAVSSFLRAPDPYSRDMCLLTMESNQQNHDVRCKPKKMAVRYVSQEMVTWDYMVSTRPPSLSSSLPSAIVKVN